MNYTALFNFVIIVDDNREMKTLVPEDFTSGQQALLAQYLNEALDRKFLRETPVPAEPFNDQ